MPETVVVLDIDGVILRRNPVSYVIRSILAEVAFSRGLCFDYLYYLFSEEFKARVRCGRFIEAFNFQLLLENLLGRLGVRDIPLIENLINECLKPPFLEVYKDAIKFLKEADCVKLALTNGLSKFQIPILEASDVARYFADILTPDIIGFAKPDERVYKYLIGKFHNDNIVVVGDRLFFDISVAHKLGLTSILVARRMPEYLNKIPWSARGESRDMKVFLNKIYRTEASRYGYFDYIEPNYVIKTLYELPEIICKLTG